MRMLSSIVLGLMLLSTASFADETAYAPLPAGFGTRLIVKTTDRPFIAIGRLTGYAKPPVQPPLLLDRLFYASFRDNQLGADSMDDPNAVEYAAGRLNLSWASEAAPNVIAIT